MKKYLVGSLVSAVLIETIWLLFLFVFARPSEQSKKCISERALEGCEQAGFDMEYQLRRCEIAFRYCVESNIELQEQIKGEK